MQKSFYDRAVEYLRYKHVFDGIKEIKIVIDYDVNFKDIVIQTNKKKYSYVIAKNLTDSVLKMSLIDKKIVAADTKENRNFLVKNWLNFTKIETLYIIFINITDKEPSIWSVNPHAQSKWSEIKNLKKLITALASKKV